MGVDPFTAAAIGLGGASSMLNPGENEIRSFRNIFPDSRDNFVDPAQSLLFAQQGAGRLGQGMQELAMQPVTFGPAAMAQTPHFMHGGGMAMPVGLSGRDPGWQPLAGLPGRDVFQSDSREGVQGPEASPFLVPPGIENILGGGGGGGGGGGNGGGSGGGSGGSGGQVPNGQSQHYRDSFTGGDQANLMAAIRLLRNKAV